jgi:hypothetical protein
VGIDEHLPRILAVQSCTTRQTSAFR